MTKFLKAGTLLGTMMVLVFHPNRIGQEGDLSRAPKDDNQRVQKSKAKTSIFKAAVL